MHVFPILDNTYYDNGDYYHMHYQSKVMNITLSMDARGDYRACVLPEAVPATCVLHAKTKRLPEYETGRHKRLG